MYTNITEYCKNVIGRSSRTFAASFVIGEKKYSDIKSLKVMIPSVANGKITIGGTVSKNVEIIVDKVDVLPGAKICVYEGVKLDTGEYEDVPMGTYKVRSAVTKAHMTTIVAEGPLSTETELGYFSELTYPVTTIQMLEEISEAIGVPIVTDNLEELYVESKPEGYTYREVIGFIAGMHGTNAVELRDGSIAFKWYEYCEDDIFTDKADAPELSNDTFVIEKFECETGNATITRGAGKTGIVISNPLMTEAAAGALWEKIAGFSYKPATFNIKSGTPLVDEWNYFSYEGESIIATELQFVHDGGLQNTFKSVGESETASASGYKGPLAKTLERYQAELVIVKEALVNKLSVEEADIRYLQADKLEAITAEVESAVIKNLEGDFATFEALDVTNAKVAELDAFKLAASDLSAEVAKLGYATAEQLDASIARIVTLEANQVTVSGLKADFADITLSNVAVENVGKLFADVGLITSATIKDGHVTGYLDSVEVNANSVTAGTLSVDRLIFRGSVNSIVYELNNITGALQAVQSDTLNGEILTDRSITVDKIVAKSITANEIAAGVITATEIATGTITANKINMTDLVANTAFINAISTNSIVVGASNTASDAQITAQNAQTTANSASSLAQAASSSAGVAYEKAYGIEENIYVSGTTTINGGKIATGTITADKIATKSLSAEQIDVNKLFAEEITATNLHVSGSSTIGGWNVDNEKIYSDTISLRPSQITVKGSNSDTHLLPTGIWAIRRDDSNHYTQIMPGFIALQKGSDTNSATEIRFTDADDNYLLSISSDHIGYGDVDATASIYFQKHQINLNATSGFNVHADLTITGNSYMNYLECNEFYSCGPGWFEGSLTVESEIISTKDGAALRMVNGNYGAFLYNNGANVFLLLTNSGDQYGTNNTLRPWYVNCATGAVTMGSGLTVSAGGFTIGTNMTANASIVLSNNVSIYGKNTSGTVCNMAYIGTDNRMYFGSGTADRVIVGSSGNTTRTQLFSKGRIDFVANGVTSTDGKALSLIDYVFRPTVNGGIALGNSSYKFSVVYATNGTIQTSDIRYKRDIDVLDERYEVMAQLICAKSFIMDIVDERRRIGYIAQEVEALARSAGLSMDECSFINKDWVERKDYTGWEYSLDYTQINTMRIESIQKQINELKVEITTLKATN